MGSPAIFFGKFTKLLSSARGIIFQDGSMLQNDGPKNYIAHAQFEDNLTTGWTLGTVGTMTNNIPTGTPTFGSGASGNLTLSTTSSSPIAGSTSLSYASSAATTSGDMLATSAYAIDIGDQAKVLTFKYYYQASSGASNGNFSGTSSNSFGIAFWDVTNSVWLSSTANFAMTQSAGVGIATGTIQTGSSTASIRMVIYTANASAGAITILYDQFYLGPQTTLIGYAGTDPVNYTMSIGGTTTAPTKGTIAVDQANYTREGKFLYISYNYRQTAAGSAGSGSYLFPIPSGLSIDLNYTTADGGTFGVMGVSGSGQFSDNVSIQAIVTPEVYDSTHLYLVEPTGQSVGSGSTATMASTAFKLSFTAKVPIAGWSSNVSMSNDTDTRVVAMQVAQASPTVSSFSEWSPIKYTSGIIQDTNAGFSTSTGLYTVTVTGYYRISVSLAVNATYSNTTICGVGIGVNSTSSPQYLSIQTAGAAEGTLYPNGSWTIYCIAGTTLCPLVGCSGSSPSLLAQIQNNYFMVERLSGPAVIAATESVGMSYSNIAGTSITTSITNLIFSTKDYDSHNAYNTSTGIYTVPISGKYRNYSHLLTNGSSTINGYSIYLYKNGSLIGQSEGVRWATVSAPQSFQYGRTISCIAGDTLEIRIRADSGGSVLDTQVGSNVFCIERVGQ